MAKVLYFEDMKVGDEMPSLVKDPITETQLVRYSGASGDFNPLHSVHSVGVAAGYGGIIAHGLLIVGFVAQAITSWMPNRHLKKIRVRFTAVTRPGDVITVTGKVTQKMEEDRRILCEAEAKDQKGEVKIRAAFEATLPSKASA